MLWNQTDSLKSLMLVVNNSPQLLRGNTTGLKLKCNCKWKRVHALLLKHDTMVIEDKH